MARSVSSSIFTSSVALKRAARSDAQPVLGEALARVAHGAEHASGEIGAGRRTGR
jgi:hypothetical protein